MEDRTLFISSCSRRQWARRRSRRAAIWPRWSLVLTAAAVAAAVVLLIHGL